jgi:hypothetical protein
MRKLGTCCALLVGVLAAAGCRETDSRYASDPTPVYCTVMVDAPRRGDPKEGDRAVESDRRKPGSDRREPGSDRRAGRSDRDEGGDRIVGRVRFRCEDPGPEKLTLTVRLEKRTTSKWRTVASETFELTGEQTVVPLLGYRSREVAARCSPGRVRTRVEWCRESHGRTDEGDRRSGVIVDPCAPSIFG